MKIAVDTSVLLYLIDPTTKSPTDSNTGEPVQHCKERIDGLISQLQSTGSTVINPSPVLSELLIKGGSQHAAYVAALTNKRAISIADFDQRAAMENAMLRRNNKITHRSRGETKKEVSFDLQILAIARTSQVDVLYTDDENLRRRCVSAGLSVLGIGDLPIPDTHRQIGISYSDNDEDD